ncbi:MAG: oxygen-dependent tRNA uridine(34) hydroxylase TrhO, partial [Methanobacterium sp.]
ITTFYNFKNIEDVIALKEELLSFCKNNQILGTILVATEGVNATICGNQESIQKFKQFFMDKFLFADTEFKDSYTDFYPFKKIKVKIKKEIVRLDVPDLDLSNRGEYIEPKDWDEFIQREDVILIDTRNDYEIMSNDGHSGTFVGAINPNTESFREFPKWVEENLLTDEYKNKKIAMCCTGGVRCEKSTALMKKYGFKEVYHLHGGILKYLEDTNNANKMWQGNCFLFDDRISVDDFLESNTKPETNS